MVQVVEQSFHFTEPWARRAKKTQKWKLGVGEGMKVSTEGRY